MAKKSPSGIALMKQKNTLWKNKTDPKFTERLLENLEHQNLEGTEPPFNECSVLYYKGKSYKITKYGKLLSLEGEEMKPFFHFNKHWPRVRVKKMVKENGEFKEKDAEVGIFKLMDKHFWPYITGYSLKKRDPKSYILITKDGNNENLAWDNLEYVNKKLYFEKWSKREQIKLLFQFGKDDIKAIAEQTWISWQHIRRVREELRSEGKADAELAHKRRNSKKEHDIEATLEHFPIYELFLQTQGQMTNLDMAKLLFPEAAAQAKTNEEKKKLTLPIVRIRKRLQDQGKIPRDAFQEKREAAIAMLKMKTQTNQTNKQIAEALGLKKEQIDNLARQIKKEQKSE